MADIQGDSNKKLSPEVAALLAEMQKSNMEMIKELRKPSEAEQAKIDKEKRDFERKRQEGLELAKAEVKAAEMRRKSCSHVRMLGKQSHHTWRGQVTSGDGLCHPVCVQCQTEWPPFKWELYVHPEQFKSDGVNLEAKDVSKELLTDLHKRSYPKGCPRTGCFVCYPEANKVDDIKAVAVPA